MSKIIELINRQAYPKALEEIDSQLKKSRSFELHKAKAIIYMFQNNYKSAKMLFKKLIVLKLMTMT